MLLRKRWGTNWLIRPVCEPLSSLFHAEWAPVENNGRKNRLAIMHKRSSRRDWQVPRHANIEGTMRHRQGGERERERFPGLLKQLTAPPLISALDPLYTVNPRQVRRDLKTSRINRIARYCPETVSRANFQRPDRSTSRQLTAGITVEKILARPWLLNDGKLNGDVRMVKTSEERYEERTIWLAYSVLRRNLTAEDRSIANTWAE